MNTNYSRIVKAIAAIGIVVATSSAHASLIGGDFQDFQGTGLGTVNTILTIQSPGNTTTESGSVAWGGSNDVRSGDFQPGASQTLTRTIGSLDLASAADLRIVFNPVEPQNGSANTIGLDDLVLTFYSPEGTTLFSSGDFDSQTFVATDAGTGNAGFVFRLDTAQAAAAQAAAFTGNGFSENRIGLSASASSATGGPDSFFALNFRTGGGGEGGGGGNAVPEPGSIALFSLGMAALGMMTRRRRS